MGCGGTACCRICVFSDCSLWICSGGGSGKQGWGGGGGRRKKGKQGAWRGVRHTHLALQPAQLIAQAVVHLHQLLHFGLGGGQGFLHLQVLLQRDGAVRQVRGVHALCRERGSAPGAGGMGGGLGGGEGAAAHPCAVVAGRVAQQLLVRVLVGGDAVVVVLVVQVTLAPQRIVEGICGAGGGSAGAVWRSHPPLLPPPAAPILTRGAERALPLLPALGFPQDIDEQSGKLPGVEPGQLLPALGWRGDKSSEGGSKREKGGLSGALGSPGCGWRSTQG